jgi:predicted RNA methylase
MENSNREDTKNIQEAYIYAKILPEYKIYDLLNSDSVETSELLDAPESLDFSQLELEDRDSFEHILRIVRLSSSNNGDVELPPGAIIDIGKPLQYPNNEKTSLLIEDAKKNLAFMNNSTKIKKGMMMLPSSHYSTLLPYQTPQVHHILKTVFCNMGIVKTIVDCTAHIGGDTIHFAKIFPNAYIYAIEIDKEAVFCLKANIEGASKTYEETLDSNPKSFHINVERFCIIHEDITKWIKSSFAVCADFYYFDPPWGGPSYYLEKDIKLFLSGVPISSIINYIFEQNLTAKVILKTPRNFAYSDLKINIKGTTKLYAVRKRQRGIVAYYIVIITKSSNIT